MGGGYILKFTPGISRLWKIIKLKWLNNIIFQDTGTFFFTYELQEALWSGVVVSPLIGKVDFAHVIDTAVSIGHELAD